MRFVLAVDEMLGHSVKPALPGDVEIVTHQQMRDMGNADAGLRAVVMRRRCVLAIGGGKWNALPMLRSMKLPYRVPIVLVTPETRLLELAGQAEALRIFSIVTSDRQMSNALPSRAVAAECVAAWQWAGRSRRPGPPRLPVAQPASLASAQVARVLPFRRPQP